jgi:sulfide:quinone oxidoreductase
LTVATGLDRASVRAESVVVHDAERKRGADHRVEKEAQPMTEMRVVVAGAGVAGLETALALQALADTFVSVELVAPETEFIYRPLAVAEPFRVAEMRRFPLERLVHAAGATLRTGAVVSVDADRKTVTLEAGENLAYDALVLALGARPLAAIPGALTFRGPDDRAAVAALLERAVAGEVHRIAFVLPRGAAWPLPLYELALLTSEYLVNAMTRGVELVLSTPEAQPLEVFGQAASDAISEILDLRGIRVTHDEDVDADAIVALPTLEGPPLEGIPQDSHGFVATDEFGWVLGLTDIYAAGDLTQFPVKQGGIATQQADAVASSIAADAGAPVRPAGFDPVLRGLLLTGMVPRFLRSGPGTRPSLIDTQPLWWPPAKIVGRYLAPFLADHLGLSRESMRPFGTESMQVEVAIDTRDHTAWSSV